MYHEMKVFGFTIDAIASRPVVILKDERDNNTIPIWMSTGEAFAIAAELVLWDTASGSGSKDLMALFLEMTGTEVGSIIIDGLNEGVFTASVKFLRGDEAFLVSVRPCEAIIAALKYKMPILVTDEVLQRASVADVNGDGLASENNARRFADFLEHLDPATLGKYPM
jgi:bifunctional DNase/RNase